MIFQTIYLICCFCLILELWRRNSKKSLSPPKMSGWLPIIGHAWMFLGDRKHAFKISQRLSKESLEKGALTVNLGFHNMYFVSDPDDCAIVANACLDKHFFYKFGRPFFGNGLTFAEVPIWKKHRKLINFAFRPQILNSFLVVFNNQAKQLVNQFRPELGRGPFNHEPHIRLSSLESICMTAFGTDVASFGGLHTQYLEGLYNIQDIFTERFQKFWLHIDFIYNFSELKKRQDVVIKKVNEFTTAILEKRKREMKENSVHTTNELVSGQFTPFMNLILELSKESGCFSDEDILDETNTIVAAGFDTSAFTITLVLMLLGSHPDVQQKAYEELQKVFENSDRDVEKDDLVKLVYLEAVCKETIRLYPIALIIARYIVQDIKLKNCTLKAGNGVSLSFWAMHRSKVWGPDADQFRPERWLDGSLPSNPNAFGGFSIGKRACIGKTYTILSMKTVLSHIIRSYSITSDISKLELEITTLLKISAGQHISLEPRR